MKCTRCNGARVQVVLGTPIACGHCKGAGREPEAVELVETPPALDLVDSSLDLR